MVSSARAALHVVSVVCDGLLEALRGCATLATAFCATQNGDMSTLGAATRARHSM